jgi:hypothetical protein
MKRYGLFLFWFILLSGCGVLMKGKTTEPHLGVGFRHSTYGPSYEPGSVYWAELSSKMVTRFPDAEPQGIWIVGEAQDRGVLLSFPGSSTNPDIKFTSEDRNEEALTLFDSLGVHVWLQVEPGDAPVEDLIHLMLKQYSHHPCVIGVGVDVEWYHSNKEPEGQAVTNAEARAWLEAAHSHDNQYRLFLKHWLPEKMPPTFREEILFVDDSQEFSSLDEMVKEFTVWGITFAPAPVAFQYGYEADRPWWSKFQDPPGEIGRRILANIPNTEALYWVDFTALEVFPP